MKRFETPILKVESFDMENIITASGDIPVEPETVAAAKLAADDVANTTQVFTISL